MNPSCNGQKYICEINKIAIVICGAVANDCFHYIYANAYVNDQSHKLCTIAQTVSRGYNENFKCFNFNEHDYD